MGYNYAVAKDVLSDTEKNRLVCMFLNSEASNIDWEKATAEFEAASTDSMRVMLRNVLKKIEKAGGKLDDAGNVVGDASAGAGDAGAAGPAAGASGAATKTRGGKRKAAAAVAENDEQDAEPGDGVPAKKKRGWKRAGAGRKKKVKVEEDEEEAPLESVEADDA